MFPQPLVGFHQPLRHTRRRPVLNSLTWQQVTPKVSQILGGQAQPEPHLVRPKVITTQLHHLNRVLAFLDPSFCCPSLVVEARREPIASLEAEWYLEIGSPVAACFESP